MQNNISRRSFLKTSLAVGAGCYGLYYLKSIRPEKKLKGFKTNSLKHGIVISQVSDTLSTSIAPVSEEAVVKEATKRGIAALGGMDKLVSSLSIGIPVTAHGDNYHLRISYLGTNSGGNRPAVKRVEYITTSIMG